MCFIYLVPNHTLFRGRTNLNKDRLYINFKILHVIILEQYRLPNTKDHCSTIFLIVEMLLIKQFTNLMTYDRIKNIILYLKIMLE